MKFKLTVSCEVCSCGEIRDVEFTLEELKDDGISMDFECDNCGSMFEVYLNPLPNTHNE